MPNTRSSTNIEGGPIKDLIGLTNQQITEMKDTYLVMTIQDLTLLEPDDFTTIFGNEAATFMIRKRLSVLIKYLRSGGLVTTTTTMTDVAEVLQRASSASGATGTNTHVSVSAPIKLSPNDIPAFSGDIEDQESYRTKIEAMVGQTTFKHLLTRAPNNAVEKERDEELFNVFKASFNDGTAYHLVTSSILDDQGNSLLPSGHRLWQSFLTWCNSGGRKDALVKSIKDDLKALRLDGETIDGFSYVNMFITKHSELDRLGSSISSNDRMSTFVDHIEDEDFSVVKELLQGVIMKVDRGEAQLNDKEFYDSVESRQRALNKETERDMEAKSRRQQTYRKRGSPSSSGYKSDDSSSTASRSNERMNLSLPSALYGMLNDNQKKVFGQWRKAKTTGKQVDNGQIAKLLKSGNTDSSDDKSSKRKSRRTKKKKKKCGALKVRRTSSQNSKTTSEEVRLLMRSDSESDSNDDLEAITKPGNNTKKVAVHKVIRKSSQGIVSSPSLFQHAPICNPSNMTVTPKV